MKNPHAVALGRKGGSVRSAAKTAAARENAKKPRTRKSSPKDETNGNRKAALNNQHSNENPTFS